MLMDLDLVSGEAAQLRPTAVQERMGETVRLVSLDSVYIQKNTQRKNMKITFSFFSMLQINVVTDLILPES